MASNCYRKSTLTALNTTAQTFVTAGTILSQCHAPCMSYV